MGDGGNAITWSHRKNLALVSITDRGYAIMASVT